MDLSDVTIAESGEEVAARRLRIYALKFVIGCYRCRGYGKKLVTEIVGHESLFSMIERGFQNGIGEDIP